MLARFFSLSLLLCILIFLLSPAPLNAQATIYWKKDYIKDASGSTIAVASTLIKAVHVTELRSAINAVRAAAGLESAIWTNSSLSSAWIKAVDISELRTSLGDAVNLLGLTAPNYTDSLLIGTPTNVTIKKAHIEELRQRVK